MSDRTTYTVILSDPKVVDMQGAADAMAMVLGGVRYDHLQTIRRRTGFLGSGMTEVQANALAAALQGLGVQGFVLTENAAVQLPEATVTRNADCLPEGLRVQIGTSDANMQTVPWHHVYFVSVGQVSETRTRKAQPSAESEDLAMGAGLGMGFGMYGGLHGRLRSHRHFRPEPRPETVTTDCVDIITREPAVRLRIEAGAFNYDYLEERKQLSSRVNFGLLLGDLIGYARPYGAVCTRAVEATAGGNGYVGREARFESFKEFDAYNRHYLTLVQVVAEQMRRHDGGSS